MQGAMLYVDQGNTRAKFWLVQAGQVLCRGSVVDAADLQWELSGRDVAGIVLATVKTIDGSSALLEPWLATLPTPVRVSVSTDVLPTAYDDATKLGIDRWLGVLAARAMGAGPALVVDAGTAITLDVLTPQGMHAGGYILPGLQMQQAALAAETVRVQFPQADWRDQSLGTNTAAAVGHGSIRAICALVRELAHELGPDEPPRIYLTGGNAQDLEKFLPEAKVMNDLLLIGMQAYMRAMSGEPLFCESEQ